MPIKTDPRIDAYIQKTALFAQPILQHFRSLVHAACPDAVETIKWGCPVFEYKEMLLCSMAAFKQHCGINFFKAALMKRLLQVHLEQKEGAGSLGKITALHHLPKDTALINYIQEAMALNDAGIKKASPKKAAVNKPVIIPDDVLEILNNHPIVKTTFNNFSASHKNEYLVWINEAKMAATRSKRIATMIEWLQDRKTLNWKYERK